MPRDEYVSLIGKEFIYQTEYFRDKYEKTAQENIQTLIRALTPVKVTH
jgi:predicted metal-dependent HD superfamily phosphohydrolase